MIAITTHAIKRFRERAGDGTDQEIRQRLQTLLSESIPVELREATKRRLRERHGGDEWLVHELHALCFPLSSDKFSKGHEKVLRTVLDLREWDHEKEVFSVVTRNGKRVAIVHPPVDR